MSFSKSYPTSSLPPDFNREDQASSGRRWSWCIVLPSQWCFMLYGSHLQESFHRSVPRRSPIRRTQCGGTASSRCLPACASHHTIAPLLFFPQWLNKKGICKYRNCYPHYCSLEHSFQDMPQEFIFQIPICYTVCAITPFEILGSFLRLEITVWVLEKNNMTRFWNQKWSGK